MCIRDRAKALSKSPIWHKITTSGKVATLKEKVVKSKSRTSRKTAKRSSQVFPREKPRLFDMHVGIDYRESRNRFDAALHSSFAKPQRQVQSLMEGSYLGSSSTSPRLLVVLVTSLNCGLS